MRYAAFLLISLVLMAGAWAVIFSSDEDWCTFGRTTLPCNNGLMEKLPDWGKIKVHDAK